jgi:hypothetical protein
MCVCVCEIVCTCVCIKLQLSELTILEPLLSARGIAAVLRHIILIVKTVIRSKKHIKYDKVLMQAPPAFTQPGNTRQCGRKPPYVYVLTYS